MNSMQETTVQKFQFSGSRLYNFVFPIVTGFSLIYLLVMIFITPDADLVTSRPHTTVRDLKAEQSVLGTISRTLKNPTRPGLLS
jgi:hypothetical protein